MAHSRKIRAQAYSGHRAQERPVCFWLGERCIRVKRILRRWQEVRVAEGSKFCFQVEGEDGGIHWLCYRQREDAWFLMESF
jgi:hypothetical protein